MPIDDRTTNRSYKLPNAGNNLADDVVRLRDALAAIDADVYARYTKTEVNQLITNLINGAPGALDTLNELAAALGNDANFATTVANQLALKANASNVYSKAESDARYVQGQTQAEMVFTATANQSVFTLSTAVINKPSALVTVDGVVQPTSEYTINMTGTQLTLSEGVPAGTVVRVLVLGVASAGAPADDTVTTAKLRDKAVTASKLAEIFPDFAALLASTTAFVENTVLTAQAEGASYKVASAGATNHAFTTAGGAKLYMLSPRLAKVSTPSLPVGPITLPNTFNNTLGVSLLSNGNTVEYLLNPYDAIDFTKTDSFTNYYINYATGSNANNGLTSGAAWKTFDYAIANMTLPAILNVQDEVLGYLSKSATGGIVITGKLKIKSASPSGRTIVAAMRENYTVGTFSWAASGGNGAYVSTTASAKFYRAQFDAKYRDERGIPTPITAAASISACQSTPGTYFWNSGSSALYVHMLDNRVPDPATGWLYAESAFRHEFQQGLTTSAGVLLFENLDFLMNNGTAGLANFRYRPSTAGPSAAINGTRLGLRNCNAYGGDGNQFEIYDADVCVMDNCHARWSRNDCFNYHSFRLNDVKGEYITVYEHNCTGFYAGYDGFADQPALGTSINGSTAHDSMHILRTNGNFGGTRGAVVADVNGCHSLNYNIGAGNPGAAADPKALFWHEKLLGAGTTKEMLLWGCRGSDEGDASTSITSNAAQDSGGSSYEGTIRIQHWRGQPSGKISGAATDINGNQL